MKIIFRNQIKKTSYAVRFSILDNKKEIGRAYIYILKNDLHLEPFALLEDVFVEESYRGKNLGTKLVKAAVAEAKKRGCYKIISTSRKDRPRLHAYYEKLGLKKYGHAFRKNF